MPPPLETSSRPQSSHELRQTGACYRDHPTTMSTRPQHLPRQTRWRPCLVLPLPPLYCLVGIFLGNLLAPLRHRGAAPQRSAASRPSSRLRFRWKKAVVQRPLLRRLTGSLCPCCVARGQGAGGAYTSSQYLALAAAPAAASGGWAAAACGLWLCGWLLAGCCWLAASLLPCCYCSLSHVRCTGSTVGNFLTCRTALSASCSAWSLPALPTEYLCLPLPLPGGLLMPLSHVFPAPLFFFTCCFDCCWLLQLQPYFRGAGLISDSYEYEPVGMSKGC
eukprot:SAG25_NODE_374_length_8940_cov_97.908155_7_plen_276_part_00